MLDPASRRSFLDLVKQEHDSGCTVVQVTHRLDETALSDRTVVVAEGKIQWQGGTEEFLSMEERRLREMGFAKPPLTVLREELAKNGIVPPSTKSDISEIREKLKNNESVDRLIPEKVLNYINENELYGRKNK